MTTAHQRLLTASLIWLAMIGVGAWASLGRRSTPSDPASIRSQPGTVSRRIAPETSSLLRPRLDKAQRRIERAADKHLSEVRAFFYGARGRVKPFAEEALGLGSKWRLVVDHVPWTRGGRHEAFLRKRFEATVFSAEDLEKLVASAVAEYLADVRSIENQLLVDVRADVAHFPEAYDLGSMEATAWQARFEQAVQRSMAASGAQLQADVGLQLASLIGGEILAQVAVRLGISAGILGTGAATSWATLGIGVVVGVIVDQLIAWVWDWWADPQGELEAHLTERLDQLCQWICEGGEDVEGLRGRFQAIAAQRAQFRERALTQMLDEIQRAIP